MNAYEDSAELQCVSPSFMRTSSRPPQIPTLGPLNQVSRERIRLSLTEYRPGQTGYDFDNPDDEGLAEGDVIVALAVVRGIAGVPSGAVRATLTPIHRLPAPVPLGPLQVKPVELGDVPADFYSRVLDLRTATALIDHLSSLDPSVAIWLAQAFGDPRTFPSQVEQSRVEAKDAVQLAAQLAETELPADAFVSPPAETEDETLLQTLLNAGYEQDLEEELLPLDLQRFDGKVVGNQRAASVTVFTDKWNQKKLVVMSVNKKPIELELGVDLLYWDQSTIHSPLFSTNGLRRSPRTDSPAARNGPT